MTYVLILVLVLVAGGGFVYMRTFANRGRGAVSTRLGRYGMAGAMAGGGGGQVSEIIAPSSGPPREGPVAAQVNDAVMRSRWGAGIQARLVEADLKITPGEYVSMALAGFLVLCLIGLLVKGTVGLLIACLVGPFIPRFYVRRRANKRRQAFLEQLSDIAQMMGNSMRAGFSILQSMELVAREGQYPSKDEMERVVTEVKLGLPLDAALEHLLERMPSEDLNLMVVAINVQRQVGGNLAEILLVIARTVRERVRFQRDLKALTAQARYSSYVITALPVAVGVVINFLDHEYEKYLYTSLVGEIMVTIALCMVGLGFFFLNRIAKIEV